MNPDTLKRAVELADGFWLNPYYEGKLGIYLDGQADSRNFLGSLDACPRWVKDALAAQLVRQVDAIPAKEDWRYVVTIYDDSTEVFEQARTGQSGYKMIRCTEGKNRTENTINCIVDSGVLG